MGARMEREEVREISLHEVHAWWLAAKVDGTEPSKTIQNLASRIQNPEST